ncbi:MAG: extracellular solute-binding protein [Oscillospiraceae bacterium]|nr:extracellular solute-binding protein [Oscillospiraceae bacterium]
MKRSKIITSIIITVVAVAGMLFLIFGGNTVVEPVTPEEAAWAKSYLRSSLRNPSMLYADFLNAHTGRVTPGYTTIVSQPNSTLDGGESMEYRVTVPEEGLYALLLDCAVRDRSFVTITLSIEVNGVLQYAEASNIDIPIFWTDETKVFPLDSFGDETVPGIIHLNDIRTVGLHNNTYLTTSPILFWLDKGENVLTLTNRSARTLLIGDLTVTSGNTPPAYAEYSKNRGNFIPVQGIWEINGIMYNEKNSTFLQNAATTARGATPYHPVNRLVNITMFNAIGAEAVYDFVAEDAGWYAVALHLNNDQNDFPSFVTLRVNGEIPFAEAAAFTIPGIGSTNRWQNTVFADENGEPYFIYLNKGHNTISLRSDAEPISQQLRDLRLLVEHINQFSLDIKKIVGRETDRNRTWRLTRYMPETEDTLRAYDILLRDMLTELGKHSSRGVNASTLAGLVESLTLLHRMREKPDELPLYLETLSGDRVSILMRGGNALDDLISLSFNLNMIYLFDGVSHLPRDNPPFTTAISAMGSQLWASFVSPKYAVRDDPDALNIWMNAPAILVDSLQKLADTRFTPETGIKVNFSIMPDQNRLVLASAGDTQPDIAMSIERHIPFDLAVRGALYDLTEFPDFWDIATRFAPGSMMPYLFNEGIYGFSESINFNALVYREDILDNLGIPAPDTWYDVGEMMSELQRFDMSFFKPIASGIGYKWFDQTAPLIYQFNGQFYQEDGLGTAINQPNAVKGITFLGDLFTTYALSEQVPSFFNSFRYGQTPIGITDNFNYLLIRYGAPELTGQWRLALPPGIPQEDGTISRWYIANGRAIVIFESSDKIDESWEFIKWWTSEDVQTEYAFNLLSSYGYMFLPGNIKALENSYLPDEDKAVILESINWLRDVPRSPGQYMLERTLSDIWNSIVFDGVPAQVAIDIKVIDIQREFQRKMTEFGYLDAEGNLLKPYTVRELDWIIEQIAKHNTVYP